MSTATSKAWVERNPLTHHRTSAAPVYLPPDPAWQARRDAVHYLRLLAHEYVEVDRRIVRALRLFAGELERGLVLDVLAGLRLLAQQYEPPHAMHPGDQAVAHVLRGAARAIERGEAQRGTRVSRLLLCVRCGADLADDGSACVDCNDDADLRDAAAPFCACGRVLSSCDGSRAGCGAKEVVRG